MQFEIIRIRRRTVLDGRASLLLILSLRPTEMSTTAQEKINNKINVINFLITFRGIFFCG